MRRYRITLNGIRAPRGRVAGIHWSCCRRICTPLSCLSSCCANSSQTRCSNSCRATRHTESRSADLKDMLGCGQYHRVSLEDDKQLFPAVKRECRTILSVCADVVSIRALGASWTRLEHLLNMRFCSGMLDCGVHESTKPSAGDPACLSAIWRPGWHSLSAGETG